MRSELNKIDIKGTVVIGEGEMDEAPMLYIGEKVGLGHGEEVDIAVDPLEGTNFIAKNLPNAISVMSVTKKNGLLSAPDTYMEKIAVGKGLPRNLVDLDYTVEKNINLLSKAKKTSTDKTHEWRAYEIYSCGIYKRVPFSENMIIPLESVVMIGN